MARSTARLALVVESYSTPLPVASARLTSYPASAASLAAVRHLALLASPGAPR